MTYYSMIDKNSTKSKGYGIRITKEKTVDNISNDYYSVKKLVDMCNKYDVDYDHFEDVLENYVDDYLTF